MMKLLTYLAILSLSGLLQSNTLELTPTYLNSESSYAVEFKQMSMVWTTLRMGYKIKDGIEEEDRRSSSWVDLTACSISLGKCAKYGEYLFASLYKAEKSSRYEIQGNIVTVIDCQDTANVCDIYAARSECRWWKNGTCSINEVDGSLPGAEVYYWFDNSIGITSFGVIQYSDAIISDGYPLYERWREVSTAIKLISRRGLLLE